jgi:hypothetical protein
MYIAKLTKSAGTRHYCPKIPQVPGTLGTRSNSSPGNDYFHDEERRVVLELLNGIPQSIKYQQPKLVKRKSFSVVSNCGLNKTRRM